MPSILKESCFSEVNNDPGHGKGWLDRYASLFKGKLSAIDIFLSEKNCPSRW
jgi:hypothetical protein